MDTIGKQTWWAVEWASENCCEQVDMHATAATWEGAMEMATGALTEPPGRHGKRLTRKPRVFKEGVALPDRCRCPL